MKLITMAWRNVRRNTRRTAISATAIGIASMTIVMMFSLVAGLTGEMAYNLRTFYSGDIRIRHSQFDEYMHLNPLHLNVTGTQALSASINELEGVIITSARTAFPAAIYQEGENLNAQGMGIDMQVDSMANADFVKAGKLPAPGSREVLLGTQLAKDLNLSVGDKFTALSMTMRRASNGMTFTVVGLLQLPVPELNSTFYAPIDTVQRFLKMTDRSLDLMVQLSPETDAQQVKSQIETILSNDNNSTLVVEIWDEISTSYGMIKMAQFAYALMGIIFYLLASTVIINTMMMVIFERTREIGTLASLGMESKRIVRLFILEAAFISAIGSFVGTVIGVVLVLIMEQTGLDMTEAMQGVDFEISGVVYPALTWSSVMYAFVTGVIVASLASMIPSRRAAKVKPVEAMLSL